MTALSLRLADFGRTYPKLRWVVVALVCALGIGVRAVRLGQWPIGFRPTLDFDSANAARTIYLTLTSSGSSGWEHVWLQAHVGRFLEPPVLQTLTALTYLPDGVERPWTSEIFTSLAWLAAGALLFSAIRRVTDWSGAVLGLAYILLIPFGIAISQSFQPESLVVLSLSAVIWYAVRGDVIEGRRFAIALVIGALAGLVKPGTLQVFIAAIYVMSAAQGGSLLDRRRLIRLVALIVLTALPAVVYAVVFIPNQVDSKILPQLWFELSFYKGWGKYVLRSAGLIPLIGAGLGYLMSRRLWPLGLALGLGYLAYSYIFPYHAMTHDYYQVPLLVIVAIGLGGLGQILAAAVRRGPPLQGLAIAAVVAAGIVLTFALSPRNLYETPPGASPDQPRYVAIGQELGPGQSVITYTPNYGKELAYYGKLLVAAWPTPGDIKFYATMGLPAETQEQRLADFIHGVNPHYFVITVPPAQVQDLVDFLDARYALTDSGASLRIYDLTRPLQAGIPSSVP